MPSTFVESSHGFDCLARSTLTLIALMMKRSGEPQLPPLSSTCGESGCDLCGGDALAPEDDTAFTPADTVHGQGCEAVVDSLVLYYVSLFGDACPVVPFVREQALVTATLGATPPPSQSSDLDLVVDEASDAASLLGPAPVRCPWCVLGICDRAGPWSTSVAACLASTCSGCASHPSGP